MTARRCAYCDQHLPSDAAPNRRYCDDVCKNRAYRARRRTRSATIMTIVAELADEVRQLRADLASRPTPQPQQLPLWDAYPDAPTRRPSSAPAADFNPADLEITATKADGKSTANFINSLLALQGEAPIELSVTRANAPVTDGPKPLAGGDVQFAAPDLSDFDFDLAESAAD